MTIDLSAGLSLGPSDVVATATSAGGGRTRTIVCVPTSASRLSCQTGRVSHDVSLQLKITAHVGSKVVIGTEVSLGVTVATRDGVDPHPANNRATTHTVVVGQARVTLTLTASRPTTPIGSTIIVTAAVHNSGTQSD